MHELKPCFARLAGLERVELRGEFEDVVVHRVKAEADDLVALELVIEPGLFGLLLPPLAGAGHVVAVAKGAAVRLGRIGSLGKRGLDDFVLHQRRRHVAEHGLAVRAVAIQFTST